MKIEQVALQCFTIRDHCKTEDDFAKSMERTRKIGYQAVQISGVGPIPAERIKAICDDNGLTICATHEPGKNIFEDVQSCIDRLHTLGTKYTAYPHPHVSLDSMDDINNFVAKLQKAGEAFAAAGQVLTYHNHAVEFRKFAGKTILEHIYDGTTTEALAGEIDTYWVQYGGASTVDWITKLDQRLPLLHLKDYKIPTDSNDPIMGSIGEGNMNFPEICSAAEKAGTEWFIVEQDRGYDDAFEAAASSFTYIKENLCI